MTTPPLDDLRRVKEALEAQYLASGDESHYKIPEAIAILDRLLSAKPVQQQEAEMVERVAIALSLADPDERGLPEGIGMAEFYRGLAKAAIAAMKPSQ